MKKKRLFIGIISEVPHEVLVVVGSLFEIQKELNSPTNDTREI